MSAVHHVTDRALEMHLFVPIRPRGQGRARFDRRSGRAYTPQETRAYVDTIRAAAQALWGDRPALTGAAHVQVFASFALPKRAADRVFHLQRPDVDNLVKAALDALLPVRKKRQDVLVTVWPGVLADDCQVVELSARKTWSVDGAGLTIRVWSLT